MSDLYTTTIMNDILKSTGCNSFIQVDYSSEHPKPSKYISTLENLGRFLDKQAEHQRINPNIPIYIIKISSLKLTDTEINICTGTWESCAEYINTNQIPSAPEEFLYLEVNHNYMLYDCGN